MRFQTMTLKGYVNTISEGQFCQETVPIISLDQDLKRVKHPHEDPLVIKLRIGDAIISRVLVDSGSSLDILFWDAF